MIDDIVNGWKNYFTKELNSIEVGKERALICVACKDSKGNKILKWGLHSAILPDVEIADIQGYYCSECGCPASVKVRSVNHKCPLGKW